MSFFGFGGPAAKISIAFDGEKQRATQVQKLETKKGVKTLILPVYGGKENVSGRILILPKKSIDHIGIKAEMFGVIEILYDRSSRQEFLHSVKELSPPGTISGKREFKFQFTDTNKQYESYDGLNVRLSYFIRVTVSKNYSGNIVENRQFIVQNPSVVPEINNSIKMEVGIEDCLHIEFEYDKSKYHLNDIVIGKIYFLLVRIKIKHMELAIIKREQAGQGVTENETLSKFEIMDGAPVRGESIPVRLFLSSFPLVPTQRNVSNRFSVRFFLNLVLVDEEDRRYFKQQEITLWRKAVDSLEAHAQPKSTMKYKEDE